jgi:hypothetical protein
VPSALAHLQWSKLVDDIYAVSVPLSQLAALAAAPEVVYVSAGHRITPDLVTSLPETRATLVHPPAGGAGSLTGRGVVVGIIDGGCDYSLDDFRQSPGGDTRIAFLWDQSLTPQGGEHSPAGFPHGVEYTSADINATLKAPDGTPPVVRHQFGVSSHGTHVMGIAAGNGSSADAMFPRATYVGAAPDATIIFVQPFLNDQPKTFTDSVHVAEAVTYIFQKATELRLPCVVNVSLGQNGGSHDGESLVERTFDRLLEDPGRAVVVAAGNEQVWRGHTAGMLASGQNRFLQWRVGPTGLNATGSDRTLNEMEIWYSSRDRFAVHVIDPLGEWTPVVPANSGLLDLTLRSGNRVIIDSERFTVLNGDARISIEVSPGARPFVTPGVWWVCVTAEESVQGYFDAWIERDQRDQFNAFADQSTFDAQDFDPAKTLETVPVRNLSGANWADVQGAKRARTARGQDRGTTTRTTLPQKTESGPARSAGRLVSGGALVPLMESAEMRNRHDPTEARGLAVPWVWAVLVQRLMGARGVVVDPVGPQEPG